MAYFLTMARTDATRDALQVTAPDIADPETRDRDPQPRRQRPQRFTGRLAERAVYRLELVVLIFAQRLASGYPALLSEPS